MLTVVQLVALVRNVWAVPTRSHARVYVYVYVWMHVWMWGTFGPAVVDGSPDDIQQQHKKKGEKTHNSEY